MGASNVQRGDGDRRLAGTDQPDSVLWSGTVSFQTVPAPDTFRIVIREFELIPIWTGSATGATEYGQRLVYATIIAYDYPAIAKE